MRLDALGMTMSGLCAVHCALTPVLALVLPLLGAHETEEGFRVGLAALGLLSVGGGVLLHRNVRAVPWLVGALATFIVMALSKLPLGAEVGLSILASAALITAHRINSSACRNRCPETHCGTDGADCGT